MLTIYLESIEVVAPQQYIQMAFVGLNIILDWVFIYGVGPIGGLGFTGSPIAAAVSRLAQVLVLVVYIWGIPFVGPIKKRLPQVADTWGDGWSVRAFSWQRGYDFMMEVCHLLIALYLLDIRLPIMLTHCFVFVGHSLTDHAHSLLCIRWTFAHRSCSLIALCSAEFAD